MDRVLFLGDENSDRVDGGWVDFIYLFIFCSFFFFFFRGVGGSDFFFVMMLVIILTLFKGLKRVDWKINLFILFFWRKDKLAQLLAALRLRD